MSLSRRRFIILGKENLCASKSIRLQFEYVKLQNLTSVSVTVKSHLGYVNKK